MEWMTDILSNIYPWTKFLHIISVISWMAGLFYLPRLFVHHIEQVELESETDLLFQMMERKLLRLIMNPAMVATWVFGLMLVFTPGIVDWSEFWPWSKASAVLVMTWFHHWLGWRRNDFIKGQVSHSGRDFRLMNELPTLMMVIIVLSVVVRPFS